ncbi:MAG: Uma2 family endonuclease [Spirulinaceae cyanobacterium]
MTKLIADSIVVSTPPLENGDRLSITEFERRYQAMPNLKKAELIEGIVYMASPVRSRSHGKPHAAVMAWLSNYWLATPGTDLNDNTTVILDLKNEPQPDVLLRLEEEVGGQSRINKNDYVEGAPELVVEIAASSSAYDLHDKKEVYLRSGVKESLVWQVNDQKLDWFKLHEGEYIALSPDEKGIIKSQVFPGLWLTVSSLLQGDLTKVLAIAKEGINSVEHQGFLQGLANS